MPEKISGLLGNDHFPLREHRAALPHALGTGKGAADVSYQDLMTWNRVAGRAYEVLSPMGKPQGVALRGRFGMRRLAGGLSVHWTESEEEYDLVTRLEQQPQVSLLMFLRGRAQVGLGARRYAFGRDDRPTGGLLASTEPDQFMRQGIPGQAVRKVSLGIPWEWFAAGGLLDAEGLGGLHRRLRIHGHSETWALSPRLIALTEAILCPGSLTSGLEDLALASRALDAIGATFDGLMAGEHGTRDGDGPGTDKRVTAARDFLEAHLFDDITLDAVARHAAMSVSTLQRRFKQEQGLSVIEYLRQRRLEIVRRDLERDHISVTEASFRAGYTSPANFATAFKRHFGYSPRDARRA